MKCFKLYFLLACFLLAGSAVNAQTTLQKVYAGEQLPADEGWQELKLDNSVNAIAGTVSQTVGSGVLKLVSTNEANQFSQLGWYKTGLGLDQSTGYTIEIKAKLNVAAKGSFNIQGYDNQGNGFRLGISADKLTNQSNPLDATTTVASDLTNDSEFHTYRLAVEPTGIATLYRDLEEIGEFPLSAFQFDNIVENGGFEDEEFPDFVSNAILERSTVDPFAGLSSLLMNSDGINNQTDPKEGATTRAFPLKPDTYYDFSMTRRRAISDNEWAWRDLGAYWNTQSGSVTTPVGDIDRDPTERWWNNCFETVNWETGTEVFNKGNDAEKTTIRFEFPSWIRDGYKNTSQVAIDNFILRERLNLPVGPQMPTVTAEPVFPATFTNLILNPGFEDVNLNNDGTYYEWALSDPDYPNDEGTVTPNENVPVITLKQNDLWGGQVRIQNTTKPGEGSPYQDQWAHTGNAALRYTTRDAGNNIDFHLELDANKTYRFNFWYRVPPNYDDWGWLKVKIGNGGEETVIAGNRLSWDLKKWMNYDVVFTTTDADKTLHLFTENTAHAGWWHAYIDDMVLYEVTATQPADPSDPQLAGKTNLIANGDFEDVTKDNDGENYTWALASGDQLDAGDNFPVAWNDQWGTFVRLQDIRKGDDTGYRWAHSGSKSLRFSYLADSREQFPDAHQLNINFEKELQPNKTYTFVFWLKTANYPDGGRLIIANGDVKLWEAVLNRNNIEWSRQSVTISTTEENHTLKMYTELGGWFNFYLDDLFLYEEETYVPYVFEGETYLFFGKSTNTASTDVEVEYVAVDVTGAYAPEAVSIHDVNAAAVKNLRVYSADNTLTFKAIKPASVKVYTVTGALAAQLNVQTAASIALPQGVYIVKSVAGAYTEVAKIVNK
jgi:hypothetical protein